MKETSEKNEEDDDDDDDIEHGEKSSFQLSQVGK